MQAVEALTNLIAYADDKMKYLRDLDGDDHPLSKDLKKQIEKVELSIAVCQAMLNTALPVARFRVFVKVDEIPGKQDGSEYTLCCVTVADLQAALRHVGWKSTISLHVTLWEQKEGGADMLSGYQGVTSVQYRKWIDSLVQYQDPETGRTVQ